MASPLTTVVSALLSSEYPIAPTVCEEQVMAAAESLKGDVSSALLAGLLTVTPASAGTDRAIVREEMRESRGRVVIRFLCGWISSASTAVLQKTFVACPR
jgi:hypothetical protein